MRTSSKTFRELAIGIQRAVNKRDSALLVALTGATTASAKLGAITGGEREALEYMILNNRLVSPAVEVGR